jgi:hypothetical protein
MAQHGLTTAAAAEALAAVAAKAAAFAHVAAQSAPVPQQQQVQHDSSALDTSAAAGGSGCQMNRSLGTAAPAALQCAQSSAVRSVDTDAYSKVAGSSPSRPRRVHFEVCVLLRAVGVQQQLFIFLQLLSYVCTAAVPAALYNHRTNTSECTVVRLTDRSSGPPA